jgi:hypothetical protein
MAARQPMLCVLLYLIPMLGAAIAYADMTGLPARFLAGFRSPTVAEVPA